MSYSFQIDCSKKTNLGEPVLVYCIDCNDGYKPWCQKCTIHKLRKQLQELESENAFLKQAYDSQFEITPHLIHKFIKRFPAAQPFDLVENTYFFTLTFDPSRFKNLGSDHYKEETYILHQLALMIREQFIISMYGCFELTNSGITHSHIHIRTYQPVELTRKLKERFTFNMRNKYAVKNDGPSRTVDYINKIEDGKGCENKTWFGFNLDQKLDKDDIFDLILT